MSGDPSATVKGHVDEPNRYLAFVAAVNDGINVDVSSWFPRNPVAPVPQNRNSVGPHNQLSVDP
jgi:hypothetical protein